MFLFHKKSLKNFFMLFLTAFDPYLTPHLDICMPLFGVGSVSGFISCNST